MDALKGPAVPRRLPSPTIAAKTPPSVHAQQALARESLCNALFARLGGLKAETPDEVQTTRLAAESAADELASCIAGPELDLTRISYTRKLPPNAWSALQRYAKAGNEVGITTLTVGPGINFSDTEFLQGLAQLNLHCLRSTTPVSRPVARRIFAVLPHLSKLQAQDAASPSGIVSISHIDFLSDGQKSRRRVREAWAGLDKEVNRRAGDVASTQRAASRVLAQTADVPMSAIDGGLQAMLLYTVGTGNEEVTQGIARAVLTSRDPLLEDSRKVSILTCGAPPKRPKAPHASKLRVEAQALAAATSGGRAPALRGTPTYRSALHGGNRRTGGGNRAFEPG